MKTLIQISPSSSFTGSKYGSFYDTTDQTLAINAVGAVQYNSVDYSNGVSVTNNLAGKPTRLTVTESGVYDIQFSAQLDRPSGGGGSKAFTNIWLRVNELDVPWSNTRISMESNHRYTVASWNFFIQLNAGQYAELMWSQDDAVFLASEPAGVHPAIPSVIVTVNKVS